MILFVKAAVEEMPGKSLLPPVIKRCSNSDDQQSKNSIAGDPFPGLFRGLLLKLGWASTQVGVNRSDYSLKKLIFL